MNRMSLTIPDDIMYEVKSLPSDGRTVNEKLQLHLAIGMYVSNEISLAKAAQLAGQNISEFIDILIGLSIPTLNYTEDMLLDDLRFAGKN